MDSPPCHTQLNDYRIGKGAAEHSSDTLMYHIQSYCMTVIYFLFLIGVESCDIFTRFIQQT